ncbi:hypothetical protein QFZ52_001749 [Arthrobacter woluwensis]|uniref:hypothetical protein n=1 Tax=Arthrobacter woluwensis TaxID=156980 RepID=UPI002781C323|nr:hypothetical protein [Arthrobacter woluwensis]MDQ0709097.1 hypothetical protein [Arthrobacter woluwensis]
MRTLKNPTVSGRARKLTVLGLAGAALVPLSGCGIAPLVDNYDKRESHDWPRGAEATKDGVAPAWIPAGATDVREVIRTTGAERILKYSGDVSGLPAQCTALPSGTQPGPQAETGDSRKAEDFISEATLSADWWPAGQERKASHYCGRWWVSGAHGTVYAFAPEMKTIARHLGKD